MGSNSRRRQCSAPRAGAWWLAVSLTLVCAVGGAAEPTARVEPAAPTARIVHRAAVPAVPAVPVAAAPGIVAAPVELTGPAKPGEPTARARSEVRVQSTRSSAAEPRIGRIFFSPAERRNRRGGGLDAAPAPTAAPPESRPAADERTVVNGALSLGTAGRAVWINGAAVDDSSPNKRAWTDGTGRVWLNDGAQRVRLMRPGQSIDHQGAIEDLLPAGAVTRH